MTAAIKEIPEGLYSVIYADPAWKFEAYTKERSGTPRRIDGDHYDTMTVEEMMQIPVADRAAKDCILFMWVIDTHLDQAIALGEAWGFKYKSIGFVWRKQTVHGKDHFGMGKWTRKGVEICLMFTRGKPSRLSAAVRQYIEGGTIDGDKFIDAKVREHSQKPDEIYDRIEALCQGPYLEMFSRTTKDGWAVWGNQVGKFDAPKKYDDDIEDLI